MLRLHKLCPEAKLLNYFTEYKQETGSWMRKEVLLGGLGWLAAGIISIEAWALTPMSELCNCPATTQFHIICDCAGQPTGLLYVGITAAVVGVAVLLLSKRIEGMIVEFEEEKRKRGK